MLKRDGDGRDDVGDGAGGRVPALAAECNNWGDGCKSVYVS